MKFSAQQEQALEAVRLWKESDEQVFRLFGYAGTGKTTIAKFIGADHFAAYTGKAAHVLREKGCKDASTLHSLIYDTREKSLARLRDLEQRRVADMTDHVLEMDIAREIRNLRQPSFTLKLDSPLRNSKLLVIDECSMVDRRMATDLLSFGCKVLVLGDPAQLPPVRGGGYFTKHKPDFLLTEIHRQARENPILDLATKIRTGEPWRGHQLVGKATDEEMLDYDQVICGTNARRRFINIRVRELLKIDSELPVPGDKVICLRNNHEIGIMNGSMYELFACEDTANVSVLKLHIKNGLAVHAHCAPFLGLDIRPETRRDFEEFDYGYGITCHKSQGSQWDSVLVFDESRVFRGNERRWLYTAVTRAAKHLKVVT